MKKMKENPKKGERKNEKIENKRREIIWEFGRIF